MTTDEEGDDRVCAKRKLRRFRDELLSPLPLPLKRLRPSGARALPLKLALEPTTPSTESAESLSCRSAVLPVPLPRSQELSTPTPAAESADDDRSPAGAPLLSATARLARRRTASTSSKSMAPPRRRTLDIVKGIDLVMMLRMAELLLFSF